MSSDEDSSAAPVTTQRELSVYERKMLLKKAKKMRADAEVDAEQEADDNAEAEEGASTGNSGGLGPRGKYINKHRVLIFSSRGIPHRYRHLMNDMRRLLPHSKKENKLDPRATLSQINEIAEIKSCDACIFFEVRYEFAAGFSFVPCHPQADKEQEKARSVSVVLKDPQRSFSQVLCTQRCARPSI